MDMEKSQILSLFHVRWMLHICNQDKDACHRVCWKKIAMKNYEFSALENQNTIVILK
jgi:hypothetical protein